MDIAAIRDTLKDWVKDCTGLPCRWENDPTGLQLKLPAMFVLTGPINMEPVGTDEVRWTDVDDETVQAAVVGWREFDVMVRCVARTQDPNKSAQYQLERLRTALSRPTTLAIFGAAEIAILKMSKSVQFDAPFEERFESVASATWRLTAVVDEATEETGADNRDGSETALTSVEIDSKIKSSEGTDLPAALSLEDTVISAE